MLIAFNKPWGVLSQFTDGQGRPTLADYIDVPRVYAAGRLDADSEGLLLLTDEDGLAHRITDPRGHKWKTYWVQVEGAPTPEQITQLREGVGLKEAMTRPAQARLLEPAPALWPRTPPIRVRKTVPDAWIELSIREGRNRQVRRMTAAVGLPTLRLVRISSGDYTLGELAPGEWRAIER